MKNVFFILVVMAILIPTTIHAVKTEQVEIGQNGSYDAKVRIYRDETGNLMFKDEAHASPVKLLDLSLEMTEHKDLSGLGADDHTQYLNLTRHSSDHSVSFNDSLAISPDPGGHTQLGGHLQDSDIHLSKNENEMIMASWKFDAEPEFRDSIRFSLHGVPGKADLLFEDGEDDARIRWDDGYDYFEFNRKIKGVDAETDSFLANTIIRAPATLDGSYSHSSPTGKIENFASIEGIESGNLLDKSADEDISGSWDFLNNVYIDGSLATTGLFDPQGGIKGLGKGNTITVAKSGGDFTSIQDAVNAAQEGDVILIFPGVYEEEVTINKSNISLVGIDKTKCIIQDTPEGAKRDLVRVYNTNSAISNITIANLTIYNTQTWGGGGSSAQEALDFGTPDAGGNSVTGCRVYNCILKGYQDTVFCYPNSEIIWENCYIWGGFDIASCWNASVEFHNCHFHSMHSGNGTNGYQSGGTVLIEGCLFTSDISGTSGAWDCESASLTLYFYNNTYGKGIDNGIGFVVSGGTVYAGGNNGQSTEVVGPIWGKTGGMTFQGDVNIIGDLETGSILSTGSGSFGGNLSLSDTLGAGGSLACRWYANPSGNGKWQFSCDNGSNWDVNLYRGDVNLLKTDDDLSAQSFQSNKMFWQDFSAVTSAHGNVAAYDVQDGGPTPYVATGWMVHAVNAPTYVETGNDGSCVYFPIPYLSGSILTRMRVKWQATGANDGVKLRLVKRDESGTSTDWMVVGSQQTYTDSASPYDVTVNTYDFSDETLEVNYAYAIEVESEIAATGAKLFSVGIESSKRIY